MTQHLIFDRENEQKDLKSFILSEKKSIALLTGESGVGKSYLVDAILSQMAVGEIIRFSFKDRLESSSETLSDFIRSQYQNIRPSLIARYTKLRIKDARVGWNPLYLTLEKTDDHAAVEFIYHFASTLKVEGFRIFKIENVELCQNQEDVEILKKICSCSSIDLKIVLEKGTLSDETKALQDFIKTISRREEFQNITIDAFSAPASASFYRFVHDETAPPDLQERTRGNALSILHRGKGEISEWAHRKINALPQNQLYIVAAINSIGDPVSLEMLRAVCKNVEVDTCLVALENQKIITGNHNSVYFAHPTFRGYGGGQTIAYDIKQRYFQVLKENNADGRNDFKMCELAIELGEAEKARTIAINCLKNAYQIGDAATSLYMAEVVAKLGKESPQNSFWINSIRLESLILLSRFGDAKRELEEWSTADNLRETNRRSIYHAMIQHHYYDFEASLKTLSAVATETERERAIVTAVSIANLIPLGRSEEAREFYNTLLAYLRGKELRAIEEEVLRLEARLALSSSHAVERMRDVLSTRGRWRSDLNLARFVHNLGVQEALATGARQGDERLAEARSTFETLGLPLAAYSAASQGMVFVARGDLDRAEEVTHDGLCLCQESYDRVALTNNLAVVQSLLGDHASAQRNFEAAWRFLSSTGTQLRDPIINEALSLNSAFNFCKLKCWEEAEAAISQAPRLETTRSAAARQQRFERVFAAIRERNSSLPGKVASGSGVSEDPLWLFNDFNLALMPLSFYDFPSGLALQDAQ